MTSIFIKNRRFELLSNFAELVSQKKEKLKKFVTNTFSQAPPTPLNVYEYTFLASMF